MSRKPASFHTLYLHELHALPPHTIELRFPLRILKHIAVFVLTGLPPTLYISRLHACALRPIPCWIPCFLSLTCGLAAVAARVSRGFLAVPAKGQASLRDGQAGRRTIRKVPVAMQTHVPSRRHCSRGAVRRDSLFAHRKITAFSSRRKASAVFAVRHMILMMRLMMIWIEYFREIKHSDLI